jgi:serine protease
MRKIPFFLAAATLTALAPRAMASGLPIPEDLGDDATEIAGQIIVDVKDDATETDVQDLARTYGLSLTPNSAWSATHDKLELAKVAVDGEDDVLARLSRDPRVEHAERANLLRVSFVPDDPGYGDKQWHLQRVHAEQAWNFTCGRGVTVAIIDTGVACYDHGGFSKGSDLSGTRCEGGWDFVSDRAEAADDHGHGTHVAGTVAQTTDNGKGVAGLAFCATLMPIKVLTKQGYGTTADVAEGIRFAADHGAQVINMSLGGNIKSQILEDAVNHAAKKGSIVVAAAGNSGRSVGWPAAYPGVIAVSATDQNDKIAWFSSRGPEITIGAPGVDVVQQTICNGGIKCETFASFKGTSMASPHVAGAAAMLVGMGMDDKDAVTAALAKSAVAKDDAKLYGAGVLDAGAAVAHTHWAHVAFRLGFLALFALWTGRRIRKMKGEPIKNFGAVLGALLTSAGLLPFAPLLGSLFHGPMRWIGELGMRPLGEWDLLVSANLHRYALLATAAPALVMAMLFFGVKRLRPVVGGVALGSAALMTQMAVASEIAFPLGTLALRVWMAANVVVCLWLARVSLDGKKA